MVGSPRPEAPRAGLRRLARMRLGLVAAAALALVGFPAGAAAGTGGGGDLACGDVVTTDVVLHHDLVCDAAPALVVATGGITVDLGGHTVALAGPRPEPGRDETYGDAGISLVPDVVPVPDGVTVRHGTVRGFADGIESLMPVTVERVVLVDNAVGLRTIRGGVLRDSIVARNGLGVGRYASRGLTIERSWILANEGRGLEFVDLFFDSHVTLRRSVVAGNGGDGVSVSSRLVLDDPDVSLDVQGSVIADNGGHGISITGPDDDIPAPSVGPSTLRRNLLLGNGGSGISVVGRAVDAADVTVAANLALANRGRGIDAAGVVDGGGNHAWLNRTRPQCVGVAC